MKHVLPSLPWPIDALSPKISPETMDYHYGKHHRAYVVKLNDLIKGTQFAEMPLEEILKKSNGPIFNCAAQHWNHSFFWNCLSPKGGGKPTGTITRLIENRWDSFDKFKEEFTTQAKGNFGSGWTWLVRNKKGDLAILNTSNAGTPLIDGLQPILTLDVWEHAYYIDYRNSRSNYIESFWSLVNWNYANQNLG
jgi:Fe-Mn family superoxide dismutase